MWEAISQVLTSGNATSVLAFLCLFILIVAYFGKKGILKWQTERLTIGASENERAIIRQQVEWTELEIDSLVTRPCFKDADIWRTRFILSKCFDEVLQWIIFNHIKDSSEYIAIKQEKIWNMVQTLVVREDFQNDEFKFFIYEEVEKIIKRLVFLRHQYK